MAGIGLRVTGLDEFSAKLGSMHYRLRQRHMRKALQAGSKIIVASARRLIRNRTGTLRRAFGANLKQYKSATIFFAAIGARVGYETTAAKGRIRQMIDPTNYMHFVELGARSHRTGSGAMTMRVRTSKRNGTRRVQLGLITSWSGQGQTAKRRNIRMHPGARPQRILERATAMEHGKVQYEIWNAVDTALSGK